MISGKSNKEDWSDEELAAFEKIKHKLLDKAGEIGRLPENIFDANEEPASMGRFIHNLLKKD